ncbi:hypothetical protein JB92DRAFT_3123482 [Gautieria morchelliformis]|nr:hypothetical protein JB92DRAFT_3123482 [Gautieria morchelliformis]
MTINDIPSSTPCLPLPTHTPISPSIPTPSGDASWCSAVKTAIFTDPSVLSSIINTAPRVVDFQLLGPIFKMEEVAKNPHLLNPQGIPNPILHMAHGKVYIPLSMLISASINWIRNNDSLKFVKVPNSAVQQTLDPALFSKKTFYPLTTGAKPTTTGSHLSTSSLNPGSWLAGTITGTLCVPTNSPTGSWHTMRMTSNFAPNSPASPSLSTSPATAAAKAMIKLNPQFVSDDMASKLAAGRLSSLFTVSKAHTIFGGHFRTSTLGLVPKHGKDPNTLQLIRHLSKKDSQGYSTNDWLDSDDFPMKWALSAHLATAGGIQGSVADMAITIFTFHGVDYIIKWVDDFAFLRILICTITSPSGIPEYLYHVNLNTILNISTPSGFPGTLSTTKAKPLCSLSPTLALGGPFLSSHTPHEPWHCLTGNASKCLPS